MSSSPLPKKGSFSKLINPPPIHRRATSSKILKAASKPSEPTIDPPGDQFRISNLELSLAQATQEIQALKSTNTHLKQKINLLKAQPAKPAQPLPPEQIDKRLSNLKCEFFTLLDTIFSVLEKTYNSGIGLANNEELEIKIIESLQNFQSRTLVSASKYVRQVMGWRHKFCDELISPADSGKHATAVKRNTRSVSSIIASTVKVYAVGLKEHTGGKGRLEFGKGEVIEIVSEQNNSFEGRIGHRQGRFPKEFVKIV